MSESDEDQQPNDFSGFLDIFNSTFHEAENNIQHAFRDYAEAQGLSDLVNSQELVSVSAEEISTSVNSLPIYTPRSAPVSPTLHRSRINVKALRASYESLAAASSLQNINYNIQPTKIKNKANMTLTAQQQCSTRDIRTFNRRVKTIIKDCRDLDAAIKGNKSKAEIQHLVNALEVEEEKLKQIGDKIDSYDEDDLAEDFKVDDWADEWEEVETKARIAIKDGKSWLEDTKAAAMPKKVAPGVVADTLYKQERLQVEQFSGNPMKWKFWKDTAEAVIKDMSEVQQRLWLKVKLTGTAKEVVGDHNLEDKSIEDIFEILDDNFGQPHMKVKQVAINTNEMVVLDENSAMEDIETFWNKYMNLAEQCKGEGVSGENLIIMLAMQHLPPKFRERLEVKMREKKPTYKFARTDATKPFSLVKEEMLSTYPRNNTKHIYTASPVTISSPAPTASTKVSSSAPPNFARGNNYNSPNLAGRGRGYNGFNRQYRGGARGRGYPGQYNNGYYHNPPAGPCQYCEGQHDNRDCHQYNTPEKRRQRLMELDRCRACMQHSSRHQSGCAPKAICRYNHQQEEKHFSFLCDGQGTKHPGSQFTTNASA